MKSRVTTFHWTLDKPSKKCNWFQKKCMLRVVGVAVAARLICLVCSTVLCTPQNLNGGLSLEDSGRDSPTPEVLDTLLVR